MSNNAHYGVYCISNIHPILSKDNTTSACHKSKSDDVSYLQLRSNEIIYKIYKMPRNKKSDVETSAFSRFKSKLCNVGKM